MKKINNSFFTLKTFRFILGLMPVTVLLIIRGLFFVLNIGIIKILDFLINSVIAFIYWKKLEPDTWEELL